MDSIHCTKRIPFILIALVILIAVYSVTCTAYASTTNAGVSAKVEQNGVTVKWYAASNAVKYQVLRKNGDTWERIGRTTSRSFTDTNVKKGHTYSYSVTYTDTDGNLHDDWSNARTYIRYLSEPAFTLSNTNSGVTIQWDKVYRAIQYRVLRKGPDGSWETLGYTESCSFTDKTAESGTRYSYAVRCVNDDHTQTQSYYHIRSITYVAAPVIQSASAGQNDITVKWNAVKGAGAYRVFYKVDGGWQKLTDTTGTSYVDTGVALGKSRVYTVRCLSKIGGSYISAFPSGTTGKRLSNPAVWFSARSGNKIMLKWDAVTGAGKYRVYRITDGKATRLGDTTSTGYTVDATPDKTVRYTVRCVSEDGKSLQSYYRIVTGQYTPYSFRSADRALAGCGHFNKTGGLTTEQGQALMRYMNAYYSSIGSFAYHADDAFYSSKIRNREATIWNSVYAVRKRAIEDLSLSYYNFSLYVSKVDKLSGSKIKVTVWENSQQQFRDIPVLSYTYDNEHYFTLTKGSTGKWYISDHSAECSPFYNFSYNESTQTDTQLSLALSQLEKRQATWGATTGKGVTCDHPYNRTAAKEYMLKWASQRNPSFSAYDNYGGNCMNFASQVLYNGGIRMNSRWYWKAKWDYTNSWLNVGSFADYAASATHRQLHCSTTSNYYTGDVGDLILIGLSKPRNHATVISQVIRDDEGRTIDYLLCCNTTNLKNFPAAAYHYTNQHLIRIYGWDN